jgi:hypothetical protein
MSSRTLLGVLACAFNALDTFLRRLLYETRFLVLVYQCEWLRGSYLCAIHGPSASLLPLMLQSHDSPVSEKHSHYD